MKRVTRTTVILNEDDKKFLERLIADGREPSIKSFLSKMFDVYRSMAVYDWKYPGEYYVGPSRIALISQETINSLLQYMPAEKRRDTGKIVGLAMRIPVSARIDVNPTTKENLGAVFKHLRLLGYGDITQRESLIMVKNPFLTDIDFFVGLLEGLTDQTLQIRATQPLVMEITASTST